ncbi:hypothetical protein PUN28_015067 [Cardiocondyla obscurior]|uniref:Uncharacterized protein n=1 Tax=Cardiocondyla obscurior TaxID=286306 RepID=A0AAW2F272_9HYME
MTSHLDLTTRLLSPSEVLEHVGILELTVKCEINRLELRLPKTEQIGVYAIQSFIFFKTLPHETCRSLFQPCVPFPSLTLHQSNPSSSSSGKRKEMIN